MVFFLKLAILYEGTYISLPRLLLLYDETECELNLFGFFCDFNTDLLHFSVASASIQYLNALNKMNWWLS